MRGGKPLPDHLREPLIAALQARDGRSRAQIARDVGVAPSTVGNYARELGLDDLFDTSSTRAATQSAADRRRARRSALADGLLDDIERLRKRLWGPYTVFNFGGKDNTYNSRDLPEPPVEAQRSLIQAIGTAVDRHLALDRADTDGGIDDATSMLGKLATGLEAAYRELSRPAPPSEGGDEP